MRRFHPLFAIIIALLSVLAQTPSWGDDRFKIGQIKGTQLAAFGEPILREAYRRLGHQISFHPFPSKRSLVMASDSQLDGEMLRTSRIADLYPDLIRIKVPIFNNPIYAFALRDNIVVKSWQDLSRYKIGILRGQLSLEKRTAAYQTRTFVNYETAFQFLHNNKIDLIIAPIYHAAGALTAEQNKAVRILKPALLSTPLFHYLAPHHYEMKAALTSELEKMRADGTIKEILSNVLRDKDIDLDIDFF
ncbi:transporter substrate-binding domain-containing protein [Terasakiella sp. A23]|uniref:substrate-binding periplasmic protein n=1 Tax=Terasakiella sp. FCG-A23 TaxID=3080561 RepID=UPI002955277E|nr:transporter substrate-binding domain-containing protein [Terasakiella sp. A23]MDV7338020.1 transporter substrate-binding domain-containing protein [Terasakiella sp. A23]